MLKHDKIFIYKSIIQQSIIKGPILSSCDIAGEIVLIILFNIKENDWNYNVFHPFINPT